MIVAIAVVLLAAVASAKKCHNATASVNLTSRNALFGNVAVPQTNMDAVTFVQNFTQQGRNFSNLALTGYHTVTGTYKVSFQYCEPDSGLKSNPTVQFLIHGIGFDKSYWDLSYNGYNYSYVNAATSAGYATFSIDRLGIGKSQHGESRDEIQAFIEIEAAAALTNMLRAGTIPGVKQSFSRVVHVGHSFGSAQSYALANKYPTITDGLVLTGFSMNSSFVPFFFTGANFQQANLNQPLRFGDITLADYMTAQTYLAATPILDLIAGIDPTKALPKGQDLPNGYLISGNIGANQLLFALPNYYDPNLLVIGELSKQPVTIGELLTLGSAPMMNQFAGPVLVLTGQQDVPYCGGNCLATGDPAVASIPSAVKMNFPMVADANFTAYIQPNTAHGINLHYNATGAYQVIQSYLMSKGF